jgi:hypothetical protein
MAMTRKEPFKIWIMPSYKLDCVKVKPILRGLNFKYLLFTNLIEQASEFKI